jgi:hypothetical protein
MKKLNPITIMIAFFLVVAASILTYFFCGSGIFPYLLYFIVLIFIDFLFALYLIRLVKGINNRNISILEIVFTLFFGLFGLLYAIYCIIVGRFMTPTRSLNSIVIDHATTPLFFDLNLIIFIFMPLMFLLGGVFLVYHKFIRIKK